MKTLFLIQCNFMYNFLIIENIEPQIVKDMCSKGKNILRCF